AIGQSRESVYIANVVKCRPPNNRAPQPAEAAACRAYLQRQISLVRPDVILAVGEITAQNLLQTDEPLERMRGREHKLEGVRLVVTYHPANLLSSPSQKPKVWSDLCFANPLSMIEA
ncbi:MAG: uracil-DNA glycosylase, partial [Woeseiaceae bacterium]|nr:uracil-DNA glycosylase [Woeseiaceae bacterium]